MQSVELNWLTPEDAEQVKRQAVSSAVAVWMEFISTFKLAGLLLFYSGGTAQERSARGTHGG